MNDKLQTARRIILFVGITWLVVFLTPRIFPSREIPVTAAPPAAETAMDTPVLSGATGAGDPASQLSTAQGVAPPADSNLVVSTIPVESVTVTTPVSEYLFSNRGASILAAEMSLFESRNGTPGNVQLLRDNEAMLRYSIVLGSDSIPLSNVVFSSNVENMASGPPRITYTAPIPNSAAELMIRYEAVPDSYVVRVSGELRGSNGARALLITHLPSGLKSAEADTAEDLTHYSVAYKPVGRDAEGVTFAKLKPGDKKVETHPLQWVTVKSKYFMVAMLKPEGADGFFGVDITGGPRMSRSATHVAAAVVDDIASGTFQFEIFAGPQEFNRLAAMGRDFQNSNPYGGFLQPIIQPFAVIVMKALLWLKKTTSFNYGWVLVIFGVIVRLLLWPLNQRAMRSSIQMQRLQPELQAVQAKYKGNPQKQQEEIMRVYKSHGMTPFSPLAGCLPMLIPMPVLFALFFVFRNTIEFRGVPFLWLPDISLKDPYYIVPIVMGLSMFVMSWLGARNAPQNPQTKMMLYILPIMMTVLFLNFASGLNLYYAVQNIAALPQQWLLAKEKGKLAATTTAVEAPRTESRSGKKKKDSG